MIKILVKYYSKYHQAIRILLYKFLSTNKNVKNEAKINVPTLFIGNGEISFGKNVSLGYFPSPMFYDGSVYIESRNKEANVIFGNNIFINNNFRLICDKTTIHIADNVLIGTNVEIIDSDFHEIEPSARHGGKHICQPVFIEENVFIGSNSKIMKGVTIGKNSVIANGAIVIKDVPSNVVVGGIPAKILKSI